MLFVLTEVLNPILPLFYFSRFSLPCILATAILDPFFLFFPGSSEVKASACNVGDLGSIPGLGRSPGEGNGNHSSILAWWIPWMEEPGGLQSTGSQRVGHDWATWLCCHCLSMSRRFCSLIYSFSLSPSPCSTLTFSHFWPGPFGSESIHVRS